MLGRITDQAEHQRQEEWLTQWAAYLAEPPPLTIDKAEAIRRALPWREFLRQWAEEQPDGFVRELLIGLESYGVDVRQLARECGGGRLEELLPVGDWPRSVRWGNRMIVERGDSWYVARQALREELAGVWRAVWEHRRGVDGVFSS